MVDIKQRVNIKRNDIVTFWEEPDFEGILFFEYTPALEMNVDIAKRLVKDRLNYTNGESRFCLIDITNLKSVTKEAREYMSDPKGGLIGISGGAFISSSVLTTVIVNLFFKINRPEIPSRFFTDRTDALSWLAKIKNESKIG